MLLSWNRISLGAAMPACLSSWHVPDFICESGLVLCTSLLMWVDLFCSTMAAVCRALLVFCTAGNLFCFLHNKKISKKQVFVFPPADWVSARCSQDEEEFLRCQGPLQIPPQLPGMLTDADNTHAQQNDTHNIVVVKMPCGQKCVCTITELQKVPTTQRVPQPTLLPEQNPSDTWRWVHSVTHSVTHSPTHTYTHHLWVWIDAVNLTDVCEVQVRNTTALLSWFSV